MTAAKLRLVKLRYL